MVKVHANHGARLLGKLDHCRTNDIEGNKWLVALGVSNHNRVPKLLGSV